MKTTYTYTYTYTPTRLNFILLWLLTYGEYSSQGKKKNFMLNAGKMNEHLFIKVTVYLPFSFRKKISTKQDNASTEISYQF